MNQRLFYGLVVVAVLFAAIDLGHTFHLGYHKHMYFETPEVWINFYGFFGLIACVVVLVGGKVLRNILRPNDGGDQ